MRHLLFVVAVAVAAGACQTGPYNGTTVSGSVVGKSLLFQGYWNEPSTSIRLQIMTDPTKDPGNDANWVQFASAVSETSPTTVNSTDPLYYWSVNAVPVPSSGVAGRWPQGGLARVRAIHLDPDGDRVLTAFDEVTFPDCLSEQLNADADWVTIGTKCAGVGGTALVSTSNIPTPVGGFLAKKGEITQAQTSAYYVAIGAPPTLALFKAAYGFPTGEVTTTYYNDGDLGIGREMHCKARPGGGVVCYVVNYSAQAGQALFGTDPTATLANAAAHTGAFATVAMIYDGSATNPVKFMVYNAAGNISTTAQLDSTGGNVSIPNNCLSCHGINSSYNATTHVVTNAKFLPFDVFSFKYSTQSNLTFSAQANKFRQLNSLILHANPSAAITEYVDGLYAPKDVDDASAVANPDFIPPAWENVNGSLAGKAIYNGVIRVACRTCHMSATSSALDFNDPDDFSTFFTSIRADICGSAHTMPHAERVMKKFWESGARAYFTGAYHGTTYPDPFQACKP